MEWNIPSENAIITRLDELYEALDRFPDSPMAPAWQHEIERKHILHLAACLREAADRPGMNLAALCKTAEHYVQNHQRTENRQELALLIAARDAIKARSNAK